MSAICIALLGMVLGQYLRAELRRAALGDAAREAESVARLAIGPRLSADDLAHGLSRARAQRIAAALDDELVSEHITRVKIWSRDGRVIYSDDGGLIGQRFPIARDLEEALDGEIEAEISEPENKRESAGDSAHGTQLEVYAPLRFARGSRPAGAFELYQPYAPIADRIVAQSVRVALLLVGGLTLLYAALFRIVASASRRLRAQSQALEAQAQELRRQAREKERQALRDALTGLPNRTLFRDRVSQAIRSATRSRRRAAVLLI